MFRSYIFGLLLGFCVVSLGAQTSEFTFQGRLTDNSLPATASYDFQITFWDAAVAGMQIGTTQTVSDAPVTGGLFTLQLSGRDPFFGGAKFMQIAVRPAGGGSFVTLNPRHAVTSTPFSLLSAAASTADSLSDLCSLCVTDAKINSVSASKITGTVSNATNAINVTGIVPIANGGTGSATQNFVDLSTNQNVGGNKSFAGVISGNGSGLTNVPGTVRWNNVTATSQQASVNNGYFANNFDEVRVTLPMGPSIGDIVRVTGSGIHGWKIAQNPGQVIYLGGLMPLPSVNWTEHQPPQPPVEGWMDIASSSNGSKLVAVTFFSIFTSADSGQTWTARTPPPGNQYWGGVASSADGTKLVALDGANGTNGGLWTSTDSGVTWTQRFGSPTFDGWADVASSADGTKLVAVEADGYIYTSINSGVTWTQRANDRSWRSVASSADGTKLAAVVAGGRVWTSTNSGVNWVSHESDRNWVSIASSDDGVKLVALDRAAGSASNGGYIYTSTDSGETWTARESRQPWQAVASSSDGSKLVAVSMTAASQGRIYVSGDSGRFWTTQDTDRMWRAVASSASGAKLFAVTREDPDTGRFYSSPAAAPLPYTTVGSSGYLIGKQFSSIELKYIGGGVFLPLSFTGSFIGK